MNEQTEQEETYTDPKERARELEDFDMFDPKAPTYQTYVAPRLLANLHLFTKKEQ
jgi:hypothetical protein